MTTKKEAATLKHLIHDALFSDIISGQYPPDYVFTEKFLMEKYQVSRAPIREALTALVSQQVLQSVPRQGYKIILPDDTTLMDVTRTRAVLEPSFLLKYGRQIRPEQLEPLRAICRKYDALGSDQTVERWQVNCEFHTSLLDLCGNRFASQVLERALNIQTIFFMIKSKDEYYVDDLHTVVLDYLERGNLEMAARLLRTDIDMLSDGFHSRIWDPGNTAADLGKELGNV